MCSTPYAVLVWHLRSLAKCRSIAITQTLWIWSQLTFLSSLERISDPSKRSMAPVVSWEERVGLYGLVLAALLRPPKTVVKLHLRVKKSPTTSLRLPLPPSARPAMIAAPSSSARSTLLESSSWHREMLSNSVTRRGASSGLGTVHGPIPKLTYFQLLCCGRGCQQTLSRNSQPPILALFLCESVLTHRPLLRRVLQWPRGDQIAARRVSRRPAWLQRLTKHSTLPSPGPISRANERTPASPFATHASARLDKQSMIATLALPRTMPASALDGSTKPAHPYPYAGLPQHLPPIKSSLGKETVDAFEQRGNGRANGTPIQSMPNGRSSQQVGDGGQALPQQDDPPHPDRRVHPFHGRVESLDAQKQHDTRQRDDGHFASVQCSEMQDGGRTTHVKLGSLEVTDGTEDVAGDMRSSSSLDQDPRAPGLLQPHSGLQTSTSVHRVSSPPTFNHNRHTLEPPYRLQHRHTLEVPRLSTSRALESSNNTDDVVSASGRFSPNTPTRRKGSISLARRATRSIHSDMHLDEVPQDEDAARWAELIRQKRASKRKRKEDEDDDRVVVGTKVDQNHVNWVTAYNMLTGIRFTVSRTNAKMDRDLTDADFEAKHKFSFDMYVESSNHRLDTQLH